MYSVGDECKDLYEKRTSISCNVRMRFRNGFFACASATRVSSFVLLRSDSSFWSFCLAVAFRGPRGFTFGKFFSSASSGWMGLYAAVASRPAYFRMICMPPGCSCRLSNGSSSHLLPYRTYRKESCDIIHIVLNNHPAITGAIEVGFRVYSCQNMRTFASCAVPRRSGTR